MYVLWPQPGPRDPQHDLQVIIDFVREKNGLELEGAKGTVGVDTIPDVNDLNNVGLRLVMYMREQGADVDKYTIGMSLVGTDAGLRVQVAWAFRKSSSSVSPKVIVGVLVAIILIGAALTLLA